MEDAEDFDVFSTLEWTMRFSQRVPKGKPLEQKLAKTAKANTERRAKYFGRSDHERRYLVKRR